MNVKGIFNKIIKTFPERLDAEQYLVCLFIRQHPILEEDASYIWELYGGFKQKFQCDDIDQFLAEEGTLTITDLGELFELLVVSSDKKKNGIVYTPKEVREYIIEQTFNFNSAPIVIDPACGCGLFLITAALFIEQIYNVPIKEIIEHYLYGIDIDQNAVRRAKVLLLLFTYLNGGSGRVDFNLYVGDALNPDLLETLRQSVNGFDCVIGNPPYVRFRNLSDEGKTYLDCWKTARGGNVDLYMPFFEAGLSLLKENGILGYITPNGYLQGVNGKNLRDYLINLNHPIKIVDFRETQIFNGVTSYTCITMIQFANINPIIKYVRANDIHKLQDCIFTEYKMKDFLPGDPWRMRKADVDSVIEKLEHSGISLKNWKIRNGLATLKNDLYFFTPTAVNEEFYYREYDGKSYKIEKDICIKVVKPNIISNEEDLKSKYEMAIFPYEKIENGFQILKESTLINRYPYAYKFLSDHKTELQQRDKGLGKYAAWYAYGRTQGMNNFGKKLLIPYVAGKATAVLSLDPDVLFYCGYALISDDEQELRVLKRFLESDAFWYYIFHTSKPYAKGYMAFAKNYLVNFTIPVMTPAEQQELLSLHDNKSINEWIWEKYQINTDSLPM